MLSTDIHLASEKLRSGEVVAFPTETVYGLGADATNESAIAKIYRTKGRPGNNPLIIHTDCVDSVARYVTLRERSRVMGQFLRLQHLWPGPLTIVFPDKHDSICDLATSGLTSVGVRVPNHPIARELLAATDLPIAAPSANRSTYVSATTAQHVSDCFGQDLFILDGGQTSVGLESTIVKIEENGPAQLLRAGLIRQEELSEALGELVELGPKLGGAPGREKDCAMLSPGQFRKHYSPKTPVRLFNDRGSLASFIEQNSKQSTGLLLFSKETAIHGKNSVLRTLSESGDHHECAQNLYAALRELDNRQLDLICIERPKNGPLYEALIDRIERAAEK
ncbi:MAG: threonylcarbamoyl-AMP synthase [Bdellovibrionales bacterium]|nr:threonylcarbamoyl-AMP synthase [Bdellovibrionales bacterium]